MSFERLVLLGEYQTELEAEVVRGVLERGGVRAFLSNSASATALSYVGTAVGGTKIQVAEKDLGMAQQLLDRDLSESSDATEWYCSNCDEEQGAGFDVCWKCGQDRQLVGKPLETNSDLGNRHDARYATSQLTEMRDIERDVVRAWRASIFGIVILPFILHLYSSFLLIAVTFTGQKLSSSTRKLFWGAAAIDLTVFFVIYSIIKFAA